MRSRKFEKCIKCGTTETKHVAKGLCRRCYTLNTEAEHKKHQRHKRGVADNYLTKEKLLELYVEKKMSLTDIGKLAGCTRVNVHYKMKKFGIDARSKTDARTMALDKGKIKTTRIDKFGNEEEVIFQKIRYNENFFKTWSAEMAYVLGLIYTDGNLHIRKDKSGYDLGILSFGQKDIELVEKFLKLMNCDATIRYRERRELESTTAGELYYFCIGNNDIANDLVRLGVTPNKSLDMQFPDIPDDYLRHFVRGFFDGDGSVFLDQGKYIRIMLLSGSISFMETLNEKLSSSGLPMRNIYGDYKQQRNAHYIRYGTKHALKFFNLIYRDVPEFMYYSRKHQIFLDYFNSNIK